MLKLRRGTFESNSSSMHTLIRVPNEKARGYLEAHDYSDVPHVNPYAKRYKFNNDHYYGRITCGLLKTPLDKATYLITYFGADATEVEEIPHYKEILKEVQKSHPNFEGWIPNKPATEEDSWYSDYFGDIDHESRWILDSMTTEEILETINDPDVIYVITCDSSAVMYEMEREGLITEKDIISE